MRLRSFVLVAALIAASFVSPRTALAQAVATDPMADGLMPSDYLRVSAGYVAPVNPSGSLRDWKSGVGANLFWENWQQGASGVGRVGFGLGIGYSLLPLDEAQLLRDFTPPTGGAITAATASKANILEITSEVRIRIPAPYIMPTVNIGFGFMNWAPGEIHYTTATTTGSAKQQHRSGAEVSLGGGLDKNIYDRYALFAEAMWSYGFTSFGSGFATPNSTCASNGCDILKNTSIGTVRGGLRVRIGQ
ncbi:MAG TPA: hypothetical protein VH277_07880 [Gemmatimonadaceae bacterium]|jgi:hypothetical protein|nr:hypothetical protein [Gemmatimonadaceae bacterium]